MQRESLNERSYDDALKCVSRGLLPLLERTDGAIYGSWAIRLQSPRFRRLPQDLDFELVMPNQTYGDAIVQIFQHAKVDVIRHEQVKFSQDILGKPVVGRALVSVRSRPKELVPVLLGFKLVGSAMHKRTRIHCVCGDGEFELPMLPLETCIAQKVVRLSLPRALGKRHTRWQDAIDLYDLLLDKELIEMRAGSLAEAMRFEWSIRGNGSSLRLLAPPAEWADFWDTACFCSDIRRLPPNETVNVINEIVAALLGELFISRVIKLLMRDDQFPSTGSKLGLLETGEGARRTRHDRTSS